MCIEANVIRDGKVIECATVGELAAALEVSPSTVSEDPAHGCLCNAHWQALGARQATEAEGYPFPEYIIEHPPRSEGARS